MSTARRVTYLSQEWLDLSTRLMGAVPAYTATDLVMQCLMTRCPDGGDTWFIRRFVNGRLESSVWGIDDDADVTLTTSYVDSVRLLKGEVDERQALRERQIVITGNIGLLRELAPMTSSPEYQACLVELVERTEFGDDRAGTRESE